MTEDEPKIDPSKIRVGDEVDVRLRITRHLHSETKSIAMAAGPPWFGEVAVFPEAIIAHHPRQLQVGDKVSLGSKSQCWTVLGLDAAWAWIKSAQGDYTLQMIDRLERVQ